MASPRHHHSSLLSRPLASRKSLDSADSIDEKATLLPTPLSTTTPNGLGPLRSPAWWAEGDAASILLAALIAAPFALRRLNGPSFPVPWAFDFETI
jgi:hypothetical protein